MSSTDSKITRDDLESKLVELQTGIDAAAHSAKDLGKKLGIVAGVVLLLLVFFLGRRRGKLAKTIVEIRRF